MMGVYTYSVVWLSCSYFQLRFRAVRSQSSQSKKSKSQIFQAIYLFVW